MVCSILLFSCSVLSNFLQPRGHQAYLPSLSPGVCSNSCPSSRWCNPTVSSSVASLSICSQSSSSASGSFPMSQLFESDGQSIRVSALVSVLPVNIHGWFPLGWTGLISLLFKGLSRVFLMLGVCKEEMHLNKLERLYSVEEMVPRLSWTDIWSC